MSTSKRVTAHRSLFDHFEPEHDLDTVQQRRRRGHLETIDYTAFAANETVMSSALGSVDPASAQRLAVAAANARAQWVKVALDLAAAGHAPTKDEIAALADRRMAFEELCEAYEGLRRMVERGYVHYPAAGDAT